MLPCVCTNWFIRCCCSVAAALQAVVRIFATSAAAVTQMIKAYMGDDSLLPSSKLLRNQGVHTWRGMLGYVQKQRNEPHYRLEVHNVSDEQLQAGINFYSVNAASAATKGKKPLSPTSIIQVRASAFTS